MIHITGQIYSEDNYRKCHVCGIYDAFKIPGAFLKGSTTVKGKVQ